MKQQCHVSFIYGSWLILLCGLIVYLVRGSYLQAGLWIVFIVLFLWLYVRYFPRISRYMGYGSVDDRKPTDVHITKTTVSLYTGLGCPFCPIVKKRLQELQSRMGFELKETDVTIKPDVLLKKGIQALPVIEVGDSRWVGNATSEQLAAFIANSTLAPAN